MWSETANEIRDWHRKCNAAMKIRKRADLALGANLRSWLGWKKDLPKEESERIKQLAQDLIACGELEVKRVKIIAENWRRDAEGKKPKVVPAPHALFDSDEFENYGEFIAMAINSRAPTDAYEAHAVKAMEQLAEQLPVWSGFGKGVDGFGSKSLARIIGEAGELSNYATHSKLWRRMCMAPYAKDDSSHCGKQWRAKGGMTKDDWIAFGYSGRRRSVMYVIEASLMKAADHYYRVYLSRRDYLRDRAAFLGKTVAPSAKIPKARASEFVSDGEISAQAKHYMGKKLLRDLWQAWRRADEIVPERADRALPAAVHSAAPDGAGEAIVTVPVTAAQRMPPRQSKKAPAGAVAAIETMPKGHARSAATKPSKAAKAAGRASTPLPVKATLAVPDHSSEDAL